MKFDHAYSELDLNNPSQVVVHLSARQRINSGFSLSGVQKRFNFGQLGRLDKGYGYPQGLKIYRTSVLMVKVLGEETILLVVDDKVDNAIENPVTLS